MNKDALIKFGPPGLILAGVMVAAYYLLKPSAKESKRDNVATLDVALLTQPEPSPAPAPAPEPEPLKEKSL